MIPFAMSPDKTNQPIAERVGIYDTDDERIRALGEVLITDVSRTVLKLLFATVALQGTGQSSDVSNGIQAPSGGGYTSYNPFYNAVGGPYSGDGGIGSGASLEEMLKLAREKVTMAAQSPHAGSGTPFFSSGSLPDFFWPVVITLAIVAFGLSIEIVLRVLKVKKEN